MRAAVWFVGAIALLSWLGCSGDSDNGVCKRHDDPPSVDGGLQCGQPFQLNEVDGQGHVVGPGLFGIKVVEYVHVNAGGIVETDTISVLLMLASFDQKEGSQDLDLGIQLCQIQIPKVDLDKGSITDEHIARRYGTHSKDSMKESADKTNSTQSKDVPHNHRIRKKEPGTSLAEVEQKLMKDIHQNPFDGVVKRYSRLGISRRRGNHAKQGLIGKGVIQPVEIPTRTGKVVLLDFTPSMREAMKRNRVDVPKRKEGGIVHNYWKNEIRKQLEKDGWTVELEKPIGNNMAIDLYAEKDSKRIAVEIETGTRGAENIKKLIPLDLDRIISFSTTDAVKSKTLRDLKTLIISANNLTFGTSNNIQESLHPR